MKIMVIFNDEDDELQDSGNEIDDDDDDDEDEDEDDEDDD